jgi:hypothetical protein
MRASSLLLTSFVRNLRLSVVILWAIFLAGIDTAFAFIGLDLNFLFYLMAVCTSGAVFPIGLLMCWTRLNKAGAIFGIIGGLVMGIVAWLVTAVTVEGTISITTLTASKVILSGSLSALGTGAIVSIGLSLIKPASFDFELTRAIGHGPVVSKPASASTEKVPKQENVQVSESNDLPYEPALHSVEGGGRTEESESQYAEELIKLEASQTRFRIITGLFLLIIRECNILIHPKYELTVIQLSLFPPRLPALLLSTRRRSSFFSASRPRPLCLLLWFLLFS